MNTVTIECMNDNTIRVGGDLELDVELDYDLFEQGEPAQVVFSDGSVVRCIYDEDDCHWTVEVVCEGTASAERVETEPAEQPDDGEEDIVTSDTVTLRGDNLRWVAAVHQGEGEGFDR